MRKLCIQCNVSPGQFSGEYAVRAADASGIEFSLFCPDEFLDLVKEPTWDEPVLGWMIIEVVKQEGQLALVRLPRQTLENGPYATMKVNQIQERFIREKA